MERYEVVTFLEEKGKPPKVLRRKYISVDVKTDDRDTYVYTRTRKTGELVQKHIGGEKHAKK